MTKKRGPGLLMAGIMIYAAHWIMQSFERWLGLGLQ